MVDEKLCKLDWATTNILLFNLRNVIDREERLVKVLNVRDKLIAEALDENIADLRKVRKYILSRQEEADKEYL